MEYQPGVCNIGAEHRRKRLLLGGVSFVAAIALAIVVIAADWPQWTLLFTMFPLYGAAIGYLQHRESFCIGFAGVGVYDVGDGSQDVTDPQAQEADKSRASQLNVRAVLIGVLGAFAVYGVAVAIV